jgi:hypothetical protein
LDFGGDGDGWFGAEQEPEDEAEKDDGKDGQDDDGGGMLLPEGRGDEVMRGAQRRDGVFGGVGGGGGGSPKSKEKGAEKDEGRSSSVKSPTEDGIPK